MRTIRPQETFRLSRKMAHQWHSIVFDNSELDQFLENHVAFDEDLFSVLVSEVYAYNEKD